MRVEAGQETRGKEHEVVKREEVPHWLACRTASVPRAPRERLRAQDCSQEAPAEAPHVALQSPRRRKIHTGQRRVVAAPSFRTVRSPEPGDGLVVVYGLA